MENNEIAAALRPVKRRIRRNRTIRGAAFGLAAGMGAALAVMILARFVMLPDALLWAGAAAGAGLLAGAAAGALRRVDSREAARQADRCGLKERAVTAVEMPAPETEPDGTRRELLEAQRRDACEALRKLDPRKIRVGSLRLPLAAAGIGCALCAAMLLIPNPVGQRAEEIRALQERLEKLGQQAEKAARQDEAGMTAEEKQELRRLTADLKRELRESRDEADAMVAADRAEKRLEQMEHRTAGDARTAAESAQALAEALAGAGLENLAGAASAGDAEALAQALEAMNAVEAEALKQAAEELSGAAGAAAEAMAAGAGQENAGRAAENALEALSAGQGQQAAAQSSALKQALQNIRAAMSGTSGAGLSAGEGSGSRSGNSGGQSGAGAASGQGGSGAGEGSGSGGKQESGVSGQNGGNRPGTRDPKYREGQYESIYDPERAEAGFRDEMTNQQRLGEDSLQIQAGEGRGTAGGSVPYGQVIGEYARTETQAADSENLTGEQREWVREYFRLLTEE